MVENLSRVLPEGVAPEITPNSWDVPPVFGWLQKLGSIDDAEMERVFNMGLGLVLVVKSEIADDVQATLAEMNLQNWKVGKIVKK